MVTSPQATVQCSSESPPKGEQDFQGWAKLFLTKLSQVGPMQTGGQCSVIGILSMLTLGASVAT